MPRELERDLGLYATLTISVGAMVGSGIFVLPGLAAKIAGPAVILAYLLAGLLVLPAALSKSEMATAMPEAGGTYLFIDRAMGPLLGTIAGVGAWFSLVFKSAFAVVGLGAYLLVVAPVPAGTVTAVGLGLAVVLLVVNVAGVKQSGRLQAAIVSLVLLSLVAFIADGLTYLDHTRYHPFFGAGEGGLLAATGFVFVSYAGVTKIASVAEEVEDPGRNIPLGILASIGVMMLVYTFVVFVVVGVVPADELTTSLTPMALAASAFLGDAGELAIVVVAVLALTSMANAGILSSSRFPLAMSRDSLAPAILGKIHERSNTPVYSIAFTGVVLLGLIAFVPVVDLAKLASAFQILVFVFVNVALVAFREADLPTYDPEFVAPGYPWVQLLGIGGGIVLLTQMGPISMAGAAALVVVGGVWYRVYGREKTTREGAALDAIRRSIGTQTVAYTERSIDADRGGTVLVALAPDTPPARERALLTIASHVAAHRGGGVHAARFEEVPEQVNLSSAVAGETDRDRAFERRVDDLAVTLPGTIETRAVVSHDTRRAVRNHAADVDARLLLGGLTRGRLHDELVGYDADWFMQHAPCDVAFLRERDLARIDEVAVLAQRGPHGPLKIVLAGAIAATAGATVRLVTVVGEDATSEHVRSTEAFHTELRGLCEATAVSEVVRSDDLVGGLATATADADLAVVGHDPHTLVHDLLLGDLSTELADELPCSVLLVHSRRTGSFIRRVVRRLVF